MSNNAFSRRDFGKIMAASAATFTAMPSITMAQQLTPIRVGYLHVLSVEAQLFMGNHLGSWKRAGLDIQQREFATGVDAFQALVGGSIDVLTCGGVLSNFPARGQGKVFLLNNIESSVGQIWVHPNSGINSIADLKGKKIATTRGTTAHNVLHQGLKSIGLDSRNDVQIVNQRMSDAVTAFISGAVPAVALWIPFNFSVRDKLPGARMLFSGAAYPEAAIADGWAVRNDLLGENRDLLIKFIKGWIPANEYLINKPEESIDYFHKNYYSHLSRNDVSEMFKATAFYSTNEWVKYFQNGTAAKWLNLGTQFNIDIGAMQSPMMADKYFDPSILLSAVKS